MTKETVVYGNKKRTAEILLTMGGRAVTASDIASVRAQDARDLHRSVLDCQSASGRTPTSATWYFSSKKISGQSALLLNLYAMWRRQMAAQGVDKVEAKSRAFIAAYDEYREMYGASAAIDIERFSLLVTKGYGHNWDSILENGKSAFNEGPGKVLPCTKCRTAYYVQAHHNTYHCGCSACVATA